MPSVSVVIPVLNASRTLPFCLEALLRLEPAPEEIILVDNGSKDGSLAILQTFAETHPGRAIRILHEAQRGPGPARNKGIRVATGEMVAFLDADCVADSEWLGSLIPAFQDRQVGVAAGRISATLSDTVVELFSGLFTLQTPQERIRCTRWTPTGGGFSTANLAARRKLMVDLGGFQEEAAMAEDHDLCARIYDAGYAIQYVPEAVVLHRHRTTFRDMVRQAFVFGEGHPFLVRRHLRRGVWIDLPGRSLAWEGSPVSGWIDLASADKKFLALLATSFLFPPAVVLLLGYAGYLCWDIARRVRERNMQIPFWMHSALAGCLLIKSAAMTAGRWWGSVKYGAICL